MNISSPRLESGDFDRCRIFDVDFANNIFDRPSENVGSIECKSWEYDAIYFDVSILKFLINIKILINVCI